MFLTRVLRRSAGLGGAIVVVHRAEVAGDVVANGRSRRWHEVTRLEAFERPNVVHACQAHVEYDVRRFK